MFGAVALNRSATGQDQLNAIVPWARLEQEYQPGAADEPSRISDVNRMLALARSGYSAQGYLKTICRYAKISGDTITIALDFYVWLSDLDLEYSLAADIGTIGAAVKFREHRAFPVAFAGRDMAELQYLFDGHFTPEMPFFNGAGDKLTGVIVSSSPTRVFLSEPAYCVLRAEGQVAGYRHTLKMTLDTSTGYKIENLKNTVELIWKFGDEEQKVSLDLKIPQCVEDMLVECPGNSDGKPVGWTGCLGRDCNSEDEIYLVYVNDCSGGVLAEGMEDRA